MYVTKEYDDWIIDFPSTKLNIINVNFTFTLHS